MADFDEMIEKAVQEGVAPGLVLIAGDKTGKLDYRKTFGNASLNGAGDTQQREPQPQPMSARDSAFTWMSLTKLPTAVAILQLVEQGRLSLDADVADQLPELAAQPVISSSSDGADTLVPRRAAITLRHLLSHTSGLQYPFIPGALAAYYERRARAGGEGFDMAKRRARVQERFGVPLVYEPGEGWCYGPGLDWAGLLLERTVDESLDAYVKRSVWAPLGVQEGEMPSYFPKTSSSSSSSSSDMNNVATSARGPNGKMVGVPDMPAPPAPEAAFGGEGMRGTMDTFVRLLRSLTLDDGVLLRPETAALLFEPQLRGRWDASKTALRDLLAGADWLSGVAPPQGDEYDWGLGGLLVDGDSHAYRRPGCLMWSGMFNSSWFIDRKAGVYGVFGTQCLPPGDSPIRNLTEAFQEEVYRRANKLNKSSSSP
ncbi:beta-lactamase family protein [Pyricularia oryzae]|nr:beta-lactamase family protein [Pyricularia oryzae Y34]KAI7927415.1 beta-lactamase family protein [Pyricularia oryzae]